MTNKIKRGKLFLSHLSKSHVHKFSKLKIRPVSNRYHIPGVGVVHVTLPPNYIHRPLYHARTREWFYVLRGSGKGLIGKKLIQFRPGQIVYIPPGMVHQMSTASSPIEVLVLFSPPMSLNAKKMDVCYTHNHD